MPDGPSGVDRPAPANPSMIGRPFAAFAAATQLDLARVDDLLAAMTDPDLESLHRAVTLLAHPVAVELAERRLARDRVPRAATPPAPDR